jgi:TonB family protein
MRKLGKWVFVVLLLCFGPSLIQAQDGEKEIGRHPKSEVQPIYPDLARKMNISGTVKVQIVVSPNGAVKDAKVIGGHPVLGVAALDAVRKWRFEPAPGESTGTVTFKFEPNR